MKTVNLNLTALAIVLTSGCTNTTSIIKAIGNSPASWKARITNPLYGTAEFTKFGDSTNSITFKPDGDSTQNPK